MDGQIRNRPNLFLIKNLIISFLLVLLIFGCRRSYNPYGKKEEIPSPDYEGRTKNRFFSSNRYQKPPETVVEKYHLDGKSFPEDAQKEPILDSLEFPPEANYLLGPGDVLEIIYQLRSIRQKEDYLISIQDEIEIKFFYTPDFNTNTTVRIDGKISLPIIGDVECYKKTIRELEKELIEKYSRILKDPVISVSIAKSNWAIEELKRAITTAPRGQSRLEPVRPDGYISLPLIGDVLVGGLTVPDASQSIREKYKAVGVMDVDVTVVLLEAKSSIAFVIGETLNPGPVSVQERHDVWRTVAKAGGFTENADKNHVVVAKSRKGKEERFVLDFDAWQATLDGSENTLIRRGDIIFIPKKKDQYVYLLGAIERPGRIELKPDMMLTVSKVLAQGGEIKSGANKSQVLVLRRSLEKDPIVISVDIRALFDPDNYDDPEDFPPRDHVLQPGDIIYVPDKFIGNLDRFAEAYFKNGIWTIFPFNAVLSLN